MRLQALLFSLTLAAPLGAQTLGRVDFPNSGRPAAQAPFLQGVMLLHSFEYEDAARSFREAQSADPGFALAYWGEAMTHNHPLWNERDVTAGRAALERLGATSELRRQKAGTARERRWLEAVETLYFADSAKARSDTLYSHVMERLSAESPGDDEAKAFYALSLMGLSQGVRNIPAYMRAGALALAINRRSPAHPGALHYIIHAFDDPIHAPLGLPAARDYSRIAADADHAQHMTTHIFLALGMWEETVAQNAVASGSDRTRWRPGHYTAWLGYGLQQQGKYAAAREHLELVRQQMPSPGSSRQQSYLLSMRAHFIINTELWADPVVEWRLDAPQATAGPRAMDTYAVAVARLSQGRLTEAENVLAELDRLAAERTTETTYGANPSVPGILATQLRARLAWARGDHPAAMALLRQAAGVEEGLPAEFGPPDIVKPSHELLGELLLAAGQAGEAQRSFGRALELAPGRSRALLGLLRAARLAGDLAVARQAEEQLAANWQHADPATRAELADGR
jgi:tetratricopeptide (TPR) repeat protein